MNTNNMNQNMNEQMNKFKQFQEMFRTDKNIKLPFIIIIGIVIPLLFCFLLGPTLDTRPIGGDINKDWFNNQSMIFLPYPHLWAIAMGYFIGTIILLAILLKTLPQKIKIDIVAPTIASMWMMFAIWLFPHIGFWRLLVAPLMYMAMFILTSFTLMMIAFSSGIKKMKESFAKVQNPDGTINQAAMREQERLMREQFKKKGIDIPESQNSPPQHKPKKVVDVKDKRDYIEEEMKDRYEQLREEDEKDYEDKQ